MLVQVWSREDAQGDYGMKGREQTHEWMRPIRPAWEGRHLSEAVVGLLRRGLETSHFPMWRETLSQAEPYQNEGASRGGSDPLSKFCGIWSSVPGKELETLVPVIQCKRPQVPEGRGWEESHVVYSDACRCGWRGVREVSCQVCSTSWHQVTACPQHCNPAQALACVDTIVPGYEILLRNSAPEMIFWMKGNHLSSGKHCLILHHYLFRKPIGYI